MRFSYFNSLNQSTLSEVRKDHIFSCGFQVFFFHHNLGKLFWPVQTISNENAPLRGRRARCWSPCGRRRRRAWRRTSAPKWRSRTPCRRRPKRWRCRAEAAATTCKRTFLSEEVLRSVNVSLFLCLTISVCVCVCVWAMGFVTTTTLFIRLSCYFCLSMKLMFRFFCCITWPD